MYHVKQVNILWAKSDISKTIRIFIKACLVCVLKNVFHGTLASRLILGAGPFL